MLLITHFLTQYLVIISAMNPNLNYDNYTAIGKQKSTRILIIKVTLTN